MMKRFITAAVSACMLLVSTTAFANGVTLSLGADTSQAIAQTNSQSAIFSDTNINDWYYPHMEMLVEKGGINGYTDGTFKPNNTITNAEFVKIIVGLVSETDTNTSDHWAEGYIQKAKALGIVDADELVRSDYDEPIRRQSMAKYAARTMNKVLGETPTADTSTYISEIKDWSDVCENCKEYVAEVYSKGVICGMPDGTFSGGSFTTRAEATTMLVRMIDANYRVEMYNGVAFNQTTDVMTDGKMTVEKSKNFMDITLENLKFYEENGKYYVSGTFPELPQGYENWLMITSQSKLNEPSFGLTTGFTMIEENKIPNTGSFKKELTLSNPDNLDFVVIRIGVDAIDKADSDAQSAYYNISTAHQNEITLVKETGEESVKYEYDFSKLFQW